MKSSLIWIVKLSLAIGLLYWVYQKSPFRGDLILDSFKHYWRWMLAVALVSANLAIGAFRWKMILKTFFSDLEYSYKKILSLHWMGAFFSLVLPGNVSGDAVKFYYVWKENKSRSRGQVLSSILLDRGIGLTGLLLLLALSSPLLIFFKQITPTLEKIYWVNAMVISGIVAFWLGLFFIKVGEIKVKSEKINKIFQKLEMMAKPLRSKPSVFLKGLLLSVIGQSFIILGFSVLVFPYLSSGIQLWDLFSFVPLGISALAIPITPQGIGLGHVIFSQLFAFFGEPQGALMFNFYLLLSIFAGLIGVIPYLLYKGNFENVTTKKPYHHSNF